MPSLMHSTVPQNSAAFLLILKWLNQLKIFPYVVLLHSGSKQTGIKHEELFPLPRL